MLLQSVCLILTFLLLYIDPDITMFIRTDKQNDGHMDRRKDGRMDKMTDTASC